jgi:hypothetical protein
MEQAITVVSQEYGVVVDYEDPVYQNADLVDDTDPRWKAEHPGGKSVTRPRGGAFSDSYSDDLATPLRHQELLRRITEDYNQNSGTGKFKLVKEDGTRFDLVPESGTPLDATVELPEGNPSLADAVFALASAVSKSSGPRVVVGMMPIGLARQTTYQEDGKPMVARAKLANILSGSPAPLVWRLLYDADSNRYFLSYSVARQSSTNANGEKVLTPLHQE